MTHILTIIAISFISGIISSYITLKWLGRRKSLNGEITVIEDDKKITYVINPGDDPEEIKRMKYVVLKVVTPDETVDRK